MLLGMMTGSMTRPPHSVLSVVTDSVTGPSASLAAAPLLLVKSQISIETKLCQSDSKSNFHHATAGTRSRTFPTRWEIKSKMTYFYRKHNISMKNSMQNVCVVLKDETYLKPEIVLLDVTTEHGFYFDHLPPGS